MSERPILLAPGYGIDQDMARDLSVELAERAQRPVLAADYYHHSVRRNLTTNGVPVGALIERSKQQLADTDYGEQNIDVVGHSYGAAVAIGMPNVERRALLAPALVLPERFGVVGRFLKNLGHMAIGPETRAFAVQQTKNIARSPLVSLREANELSRHDGMSTEQWLGHETLLVVYIGDQTFDDSETMKTMRGSGVKISRLATRTPHEAHYEAFLRPQATADITARHLNHQQ